MKIIYINQVVTVLLSSLLFFSSNSIAIDFFEDDDVLWTVGLNQYIKYGKQDSSKFGKNDHPAKLSERDLRYSLMALTFNEESLLSSTEEIKAVFSSLQVKVLSQYLSKGFESAKPEQDIVFSLEKTKSKLLGLKESTYLAGRAFYKEGKLNIIMGDYDFFRSKAFESAYDPSGQGAVPYNLSFGSRIKKSRVFENTHISATGIENMQIAGKRRRDWIVIDVRAAAVAYVAEKEEKQNPTSKIDKQLEIEAAKLAKQRREMRIEMARMRKEVEAVSKDSSSKKTIEERMVTLKQLLSEKLITQDEYDKKRQDILNDI